MCSTLYRLFNVLGSNSHVVTLCFWQETKNEVALLWHNMHVHSYQEPAHPIRCSSIVWMPGVSCSHSFDMAVDCRKPNSRSLSSWGASRGIQWPASCIWWYCHLPSSTYLHDTFRLGVHRCSMIRQCLSASTLIHMSDTGKRWYIVSSNIPNNVQYPYAKAGMINKHNHMPRQAWWSPFAFQGMHNTRNQKVAWCCTQCYHFRLHTYTTVGGPKALQCQCWYLHVVSAGSNKHLVEVICSESSVLESKASKQTGCSISHVSRHCALPSRSSHLLL